MSEVQRSSDVVEGFGARALATGIGAAVLLPLGGLLVAYRSMWIVLGILLMLGGLACLVVCVINVVEARKVTSVSTECPYCHKTNKLTAQPDRDFTCIHCQRLVPVAGGRILKVFQVRCGYCNELNFYNERSIGLLCESCNREIPISTSEEMQATRAFHAYSQHDEEGVYDLTLISTGRNVEPLIGVLQHMLALNRNQVKDILDNLPQTLLTGIPKRKADMLKAQLSAHEAAADVSQTVAR